MAHRKQRIEEKALYIVKGGFNNNIEEYLPLRKKKESGVDKINDDYPSHANKTNDNVNESL